MTMQDMLRNWATTAGLGTQPGGTDVGGTFYDWESDLSPREQFQRIATTGLGPGRARREAMYGMYNPLMGRYFLESPFLDNQAGGTFRDFLGQYAQPLPMGQYGTRPASQPWSTREEMLQTAEAANVLSGLTGAQLADWTSGAMPGGAAGTYLTQAGITDPLSLPAVQLRDRFSNPEAQRAVVSALAGFAPGSNTQMYGGRARTAIQGALDEMYDALVSQSAPGFNFLDWYLSQQRRGIPANTEINPPASAAGATPPPTADEILAAEEAKRLAAVAAFNPPN